MYPVVKLASFSVVTEGYRIHNPKKGSLNSCLEMSWMSYEKTMIT